MTRDEWVCPIPKLIPIHQKFDGPMVENPRQTAIDTVLSCSQVVSRIKPKNRVAIAVGSRGIRNVSKMVGGVVDALRRVGANPFIVPAMGGHGGDDIDAKISILAQLGVTEDSVGAPISRIVEVLKTGEIKDNIPGYCLKEVLSADAVILLNRIKSHTDFRGEIESGLIKMAAVGLGGTPGAQWIHEKGYDQLAHRVRAEGQTVLEVLPNCIGLAVTEGATGATAYIEAIPKEEIFLQEPALLRRARRLNPHLPIKNLDVLIVLEIGKDISGIGLDPAVTGRYPSGRPYQDEDVPNIHRIVALDLTGAALGNAAGIGFCDITTRRLYNKTNFRVMYQNIIDCKGSAAGRFPMVMESDREAISVALLTSYRPPSELKIALIRNTSKLDYLLVSETLGTECKLAGAEKIRDPFDLCFEENGSLIWPACIPAG